MLKIMCSPLNFLFLSFGFRLLPFALTAMGGEGRGALWSYGSGVRGEAQIPLWVKVRGEDSGSLSFSRGAGGFALCGLKER